MPDEIPFGPGIAKTSDGTKITIDTGGGVGIDGSGKVYARLGDGVTLDSINNLIKLNPGSGIAIDGAGKAYVPIGAGLATSGGAIIVNPGIGLGINTDGTVYIPQGAISSGNLAPGSLGSDLSKFAAAARPVIISLGLPGLPDSRYPVGTLLFNTADGKNYRNVSNAWTRGTDPQDILAGTIAAGVYYGGQISVNQIGSGTLPVGVAYIGVVNCSQLNAGTIAARISMTSADLTLNLNGITTTISNQNIGGFLSGVVVSSNATPSLAGYVGSGFVGARAVNGLGGATLSATSGSGYLGMVDFFGGTRIILNAGDGSLYLNTGNPIASAINSSGLTVGFAAGYATLSASGLSLNGVLVADLARSGRSIRHSLLFLTCSCGARAS